MHISDFDYHLPDERIATQPKNQRGKNRLLVLNRESGHVHHEHYRELIKHLEKDDVVVLNDTKVIKARLLTRNAAGQTRELLLLESHGDESDTHTRTAMHRGRLHQGEVLKMGHHRITVISPSVEGIVRIHADTNLLELAEKAGNIPLPPYMKRQATQRDVERYQTVFATKPGSVAAPTASLNFTEELKQDLLAKGVKVVYLTLHVGLGTFLPIRTDNVEEHTMHSEYFEIPAETVATIQAAKQSGSRIVAIGTTVARTLEFSADKLILGTPVTLTGEADIFIYPGYEFRLVDVLLTNFHAPKSTVLMLAAAFAGWDNLKAAYEEALAHQYDFLSYGDSMLII